MCCWLQETPVPPLAIFPLNTRWNGWSWDLHLSTTRATWRISSPKEAASLQKSRHLEVRVKNLEVSEWILTTMNGSTVECFSSDRHHNKAFLCIALFNSLTTLRSGSCDYSLDQWKIKLYEIKYHAWVLTGGVRPRLHSAQGLNRCPIRLQCMRTFNVLLALTKRNNFFCFF
jgi:hypothetical protein